MKDHLKYFKELYVKQLRNSWYGSVSKIDIDKYIRNDIEATDKLRKRLENLMTPQEFVKKHKGVQMREKTWTDGIYCYLLEADAIIVKVELFGINKPLGQWEYFHHDFKHWEEYSKTTNFKQEYFAEQKLECTCDSHDLFLYGCRCGNGRKLIESEKK